MINFVNVSRSFIFTYTYRLKKMFKNKQIYKTTLVFVLSTISKA